LNINKLFPKLILKITKANGILSNFANLILCVNLKIFKKMKSIFSTIAVILLVCQISFSQAPQRFRYQAVARTQAGAPYANTSLKIRFQILQDNDNGALIFYEEQVVATTNLGVFDANIGAGTQLQGSMSAIDWGNHSYFVRVELNASLVGGVFTTMGSSQLLSVPYALYSEKSGGNGQNLSILGNQITLSGQGGNTIMLPAAPDNSPTNEIQTLGLSGMTLSLSNGGGSVVLPNGGGGGTDQTLNLNGNVLTISGAGGNSVTLPSVAGGNYSGGNGISIINNVISNTGDADNNATNEIQQISLAGNVLTLSQNGGMINLPNGGGGNYSAGSGININNNVISAVDNSVTNEIQQISLAGNVVTLSQNGGTFTLPPGGGSNYSAGNGISIANNVITANDISPTNEIQTVSLAGNQLSLSQNGGTVTLPTGTTYTAGNGISIANNTIAANDISPTNEIQQLTLAGDQLSLSQNGGAVTLPPASLTLPYLGTGSTPNSLTAAFEIDNSGPGVGIIGRNNGSGYFTAIGLNNYSADFWGPARIVSTASTADLSIADAAGDGAKIELESGGASWTINSFNGGNFNILDQNGSGMWLGAANNPLTYLNQKDFLMYQSANPTEVSMSSDDGSGGGSMKFRARSGGQNRCGIIGNDNLMIIETGSANRIDITHAAQYTFEPWLNAGVDLGRTSYRWDFLYCIGVDQASDRRLKENIADIEPGLSAIMKMRPVHYDWKNKELGKGKQYGFIAQELEKVLPEVVSHTVLTENDLADLRKSGKPMPEITDPYGINYTAITPVLVKGMQEQQAKIEHLEAEIAELKRLVQNLIKK
jgi:Chaperone of endosialidase